MHRLPKLINRLAWSRSRICPGRSPGLAPTLLVLALLVILLPACIPLIQDRPESGRLVEAIVRPAPVQAEGKAIPSLADTGETGPASPVQEAGPQLPAGVPLSLWTKAGGQLHLIDPHTGEDLSGYKPIEVGRNLGSAALSLNRTILAAISHPAATACGITGCQLTGTTLYLVDTSTWNEATIDLAGPAKVPTVPANFFAFSPDDSVLAVTYAGPSPLLPGEASSIEKVKAPGAYWLATIDLTARTITNQIPLDVAPRFLTYTPDAGSLVLYGVPYPAWTSDSPDKNVVKAGTPRVSLIKAADLSLEYPGGHTWEVELPGLLDGQLWQETDNSPAGAFWQPAVVFAPGRGALHIVHANEEKLTTVNLAQRTLHTVEISPKQSWFERLLALTAGVAQAKMVEGTTKRAVLSEDESRLYVVGVAHETGESLGLQVIEAESGAEIAKLDTPATEIGIWPSNPPPEYPGGHLRRGTGEQLYLYGWDEAGAWTDIWDVKRLEPASVRLEGHVVPAQLLDGQAILLGRNSDQKATHLAALDAKTFKVIQAWSVEGYVVWVSAP
jgi:hypothetical protein